MRQEFPKSVKYAAWIRAGGFCEKCKTKLYYGRYQYDHIRPSAFEGKPTADNCMVLCTSCHQSKTSKEDVPRIAKSNRQRDKHIGIKRKTSRPIPGSKASGLKKLFSGEVVKR